MIKSEFSLFFQKYFNEREISIRSLRETVSLVLGIGMYSWQAQIYVRMSAFPYDGIRLTTEGVLELYRDYGGDYVSF